MQAIALQSFEADLRESVSRIDTFALSKLYKHADDYLWHNDQQLSTQAYEALAFIEKSFHHGLEPKRYHAIFLREFKPLSTSSEKKVYDYLLTDGLIKLINDISKGLLDPTIADPKWSIPQLPFNATDFLKEALKETNFKQRLNTLIPTSKQYQPLQTAIARYHKYIDEGGWPRIPDTQSIRPGDFHFLVPLIQRRLELEDDTLDLATAEQPNLYSPKLANAVKQFQIRHGLKADGIFGRATREAMNVPAEQRLKQIKINLERLRWLPDDLGQRYIMVNLANYRLTAVEDNTVKLDMRVIVGQKERETPAFSSKMKQVVLNPYWYIPKKLARLDLLPKQLSNHNYFTRNNIRIIDLNSDSEKEISPDSIDWDSVVVDTFPYSLRQDPGENNALGRMKFILPNPWAIYLHDTPSKRLFDKTERNFSSGCIRVEEPLALAEFSLRKNYDRKKISDVIASNEEHYAELAEPLSFYAVYLTVWSDGGKLFFSPDSYQRDSKMEKFL